MEQDAATFDVRDGILLETDAATRMRDLRASSGNLVGAVQPDREPSARAPRAPRPAQAVAAYWLDDRLTQVARTRRRPRRA